MGLKIADLLKYRDSVTLTNPRDEQPLLDEDGKPIVVYIRLIGDNDLEIAHKQSRLASARLRQALRDKESEAYKDRIGAISEANREELLSIIKSSRTSNLDAEARVAVERPELPKIEEFAVTPDAPSLEEQEKMDKEIQRLDDEYKKALEDYIETRTGEILAEFEGVDDEKVREAAAEELINILALGEFFNELMDQKVTYGSYTDKLCKIRAFDSVDEFKGANSSIKEQLISSYVKLEINPDEVKN